MGDQTKGFMDDSCPKCKARIGWYGRVIDRPPCRRCGHTLDQESLQHTQQQMDDFRNLMAELAQAKPGWDKWREARRAAGLTLRQAAKILELTPEMLSDIEQCHQKPSSHMTAKMIRCYEG